MKTSENINELAAALAKAQAEIKNAAFNRTNPHFKSKYADLAAVRDAVTVPLAKQGIVLVETVGKDDNQLVLFTRLIHTSGQWIESAYPIINDTAKPQAMGSALSYARRYSRSAITGIASEEDDDGNAAQEHGQQPREFDGVTGNPDAKMYKSGGNGAKAVQARENNELYSQLEREIRMATSVEALKEWAALRKADIDKLPPHAIEFLKTEFASHKASLQAREP